MVFTEFLALVESEFGSDMVDDIIDDANLPNGGAYTSVGTYNHKELVMLVTALSNRSNISSSELVKSFGRFLFSRFSKLYPAFFKDLTDSFVFLSGIEHVIHAEVLKLYPDAELPTFDVLQKGDELIMKYTSRKNFDDLAEGLIFGAADYFGDKFLVTKHPIDANSTEFRVKRC